ncbi:MAG: thiamine-monophosphate kinase [Candidatus Omnitrophica bacterium]|nr:thiamine-monophosphate kinase [Candidatus Omnitrophota bacterium]
MKELAIIDEIRRKHAKPVKGLVEGIGDDCAILEYTRDEYLLWSTDMIVENTHFDLKRASYEEVGWKAASVNVSDIAAMGGIPKFITVTFGLPRKGGSAIVRRLYNGIDKVCREFGIAVVGGDIDGSERLIVDIGILGTVEKKNVAKRSGAKPGDKILITGPVRDGKKTHLNFMPHIAAGRFLVKNFRVNSMIDTSDGIAMDLGRICRASEVGCRLYADNIPLPRGLKLEDALHYGESFELLFTMPPREAKKLLTESPHKKTAAKFFVIGDITDKKQGMKISGKPGSMKTLKMRGFEHL